MNSDLILIILYVVIALIVVIPFTRIYHRWEHSPQEVITQGDKLASAFAGIIAASIWPLAVASVIGYWICFVVAKLARLK